MNLNIRASGPSDIEHAKECMALDAHHKLLDPERWAEPLTEIITVFDEQGTVFHLRMSRVMRIDIQFDPRVDRERVMEAMQKTFAWMKVKAKASGFRELIFESSFAPLIRFCRKRFGFRESKSELTVYL